MASGDRGRGGVYPDHDDEAASVLRMAWDPDVTRGLLAQHPLTRAQDAARPLGDPALRAETTAYFDQELQGWLPVDRGLTELLGLGLRGHAAGHGRSAGALSMTAPGFSGGW